MLYVFNFEILFKGGERSHEQDKWTGSTILQKLALHHGQIMVIVDAYGHDSASHRVTVWGIFTS